MTAGLEKTLSDVGLLILRVIPAALMAGAHGWPKLMAYGEKSSSFPDPLGVSSPISMALAIFAELICSVLVIFGAATRLACTQLVFTMLVAAFVIHASDPFSKKEFALIYMIPFLVLFFTGPGRFSVDQLIRGSNRN